MPSLERVRIDDEWGEEEEERFLQSTYGLLDEEKQVDNLEVEHDEDTEWLRASGWPHWFRGKPLDILVAARQFPANEGRAYTLGRWRNMVLESSSKMEQALHHLAEMCDIIFRRCEETLLSTARTLRCWLRSWGPSYNSKPFELPRRANTTMRYRRIFKSFLCLVFRARYLEIHLHIPTLDLFGFECSIPQKHLIDAILKRIQAVDQYTDSSKDTQAIAVYEQLFQLITLFWTDLPSRKAQNETPLARFTGILGIHPTELFYRTPYDYTPFLAGLIWIGRLVLLEYALPQHAYNLLSTPWPDRTSYPDAGKRLHSIRSRFSNRGSLGPLGYMIERMAHGRAIAQREGRTCNIGWSADGNTLSIEDGSITVANLQDTVRGALSRAQTELHELMFGWDPVMRLGDIFDDLTKHQTGYSFLHDPRNKNFSHGLRFLCGLAFDSTEERLGSKGVARARSLRWLKRRDAFIQSLFSVIHLTSGMPARGSELAMIRWADTGKVMRNIYIHDGQIMLVFSYNKSSEATNNSFYIVRFPCPLAQQLLARYLIYVRPFADRLIEKLDLNRSAERHPYLFQTFREPGKHFGANQCSSYLHKSSESCTIRLHLRSYRQIAIAMAKRFVDGLTRPFDAHAPRGLEAFIHSLAVQAGHTAQTRATVYALDRAYPAKLQQTLIDNYRMNSEMWHHFLGITIDATAAWLPTSNIVANPEREDWTLPPQVPGSTTYGTGASQVKEDSQTQRSRCPTGRRALQEIDHNIDPRVILGRKSKGTQRKRRLSSDVHDDSQSDIRGNSSDEDADSDIDVLRQISQMQRQLEKLSKGLRNKKRRIR